MLFCFSSVFICGQFFQQPPRDLFGLAGLLEVTWARRPLSASSHGSHRPGGLTAFVLFVLVVKRARSGPSRASNRRALAASGDRPNSGSARRAQPDPFRGLMAPMSPSPVAITVVHPANRCGLMFKRRMIHS